MNAAHIDTVGQSLCIADVQTIFIVPAARALHFGGSSLENLSFAAFTDDAHILDPSNGDFEIGPKSVIVSSWRGWMASVDSYEARTIRTYVSRSAAVVLTDVSVVWPSGEPPMTPPLVHEARIFRFAGEPAKS